MDDTTKREKALKVTKEKILIVEGKDEENFLKALFKNISQLELQLENIQIFPLGGKDKLSKTMKALVETSGWDSVKSIGLIRDADENAKSALDSIVQVLKDNNLPIPNSPSTFSKGSPRTGIFIISDRKEQGALESLCLSTMEKNEAKIIECIDEFMKCNEKLNTRYEKPKNEDKARCKAFLSLMEEDTPSLGVAAQKNYWNWESDRLKPLIEFLKEL